jgi:hypothetical protein
MDVRHRETTDVTRLSCEVACNLGPDLLPQWVPQEGQLELVHRSLSQVPLLPTVGDSEEGPAPDGSSAPRLRST